jgi:hypothetical protein
MLVIRREQMKVFDDDARLRFEDQAVEHLRQHFPREFTALGEPGARALLPVAEERAALYGIRRQCDLLSWLGFAISFGSEFDIDPANAWMQEILASPVLDPDGKLDAIIEELSRRQ